MSSEVSFSEFFKILAKEGDLRSLVSDLAPSDLYMAERVYSGLFSRARRKKGRSLSVNEAKEVASKICRIAISLKSQSGIGSLQILDKAADIAGNVI